MTGFKWMHFVRGPDPDTVDHLSKCHSKAKTTVHHANALVANAEGYTKAEGGFKHDQKLKPRRLAKGAHDETMMHSVGHTWCFHRGFGRAQ